MSHRFSASRLRDHVEFCTSSTLTNADGRPEQIDLLVFDARANVQEKSGSQVASLGLTLSDSVITILTYFNYDARQDQIVKFNGKRYEVKHIQPSDDKQSMVVTATLEGVQSWSEDQ